MHKLELPGFLDCDCHEMPINLLPFVLFCFNVCVFDVFLKLINWLSETANVIVVVDNKYS